MYHGDHEDKRQSQTGNDREPGCNRGSTSKEISSTGQLRREQNDSNVGSQNKDIHATSLCEDGKLIYKPGLGSRERTGANSSRTGKERRLTSICPCWQHVADRKMLLGLILLLAFVAFSAQSLRGRVKDKKVVGGKMDR